MRKMSIIIGCVAVFSLAVTSVAAQAGFYRMEFHFSRPNTAPDAFRQDNIACKRAAITLRWQHWKYVGTASGGVRNGWSPPAFLRCMTDRGYRLDPNGYSSGPVRAFLPAA